jgi:hypothetical protein
VNTVMISCAVRTAARAVTVPQLEAAGFTPRVFLSPCEPAGPEGNREVAHRALSWSAAQGGDTLFVEDDIDLAPDFAWCVNLARQAGDLAYLYLNDAPGRLIQHHGRALARDILNGAPIRRGAHLVQRRSALFGTQCVFIPARLVPVMVDALEAPHSPMGRGEPFDGRLHLWARRTPAEAVRVILPHPVQHRKDRTGRDDTAREMRSYSYGLPITNPDEVFIEQRPEADVLLALQAQADGVAFDVPLRFRHRLARRARVRAPS